MVELQHGAAWTIARRFAITAAGIGVCLQGGLGLGLGCGWCEGRYVATGVWRWERVGSRVCGFWLSQDLEFFNKFQDKGLLERLNKVVDQPFARVQYEKAVEMLQEEIAKDPKKWDYPEVRCHQKWRWREEGGRVMKWGGMDDGVRGVMKG